MPTTRRSSPFASYDFGSVGRALPALDRPKYVLPELVPETCWGSNLRSLLSRQDWELCKELASKRSGSRCEICGGRGSKWPVECHEVWRYTDRGVQVLENLIALCPACHRVKHIGLAEIHGLYDQTIRHMMKVNNWSRKRCESQVTTAFTEWETRSSRTWSLDLSFLTKIGVKQPRSTGRNLHGK